MVRIEAKVVGEQVDVHSEAEGKSTEVLEESVAIVEALYENIAKHDKQLSIAYLSIMGNLVTDWMDEATNGMISGLTGGDLYA